LAESSCDIWRQSETVAATSYVLSADDEKLLEEIQYGCFRYLWDEVGSPACLVKDRSQTNVASTAAIGFQLASLAVGIEHSWITRSEGRTRARSILEALVAHPENRRCGICLHFLDPHTGRPAADSPGVEFSTVDHALLLCGAISAAEYFGGEVAAVVRRLVQESNWRAYVRAGQDRVCFGFRPDDPQHPQGPGDFIPFEWKWSSAEEQLVYLMAVGSPVERHSIEPDVYYKLERPIRRHRSLPPFVVSWNGALFTYFFSHCYIDFRSLAADDPGRFQVNAPRVDWFENARRAVLTHRQRCLEMSTEFGTLAANRWGLSPCLGYLPDGSETYLVPAVRPNAGNQEDWCGGTITPYAAGSAIMFTPRESLDVLRELRYLKRAGETGLFAWQDPRDGGCGMVDALNLDQGWAVRSQVGIDVGPMLLAIENVRTGLIWKLFQQNESVQRARQRLEWHSASDPSARGR
jgi:hypothetical protein